MRKVLIGTAVVLLAFAAPTAALADEPDPAATSAPFQSSNEDDQQDHQLGIIDPVAEDRIHHELEERYGKHGQFQIPPLVLKPSVTGANGLDAAAGNTANLSSTSLSVTLGVTQLKQPASAGTKSLTNVAANPVDFASVQLNQPTPAQQFFQISSIGLAALAAGAVVLGGTVGARALRELRAERANRP